MLNAHIYIFVYMCYNPLGGETNEKKNFADDNRIKKKTVRGSPNVFSIRIKKFQKTVDKTVYTV